TSSARSRPAPNPVKQTLQLKLSQHLTLTPQLQQSIRLLQLSTLELNAEVERMLQENPLLERAEGEGDDEHVPLPLPLAGPGRVETDAGDTRGSAADDDRAAPSSDDSPLVAEYAEYGGSDADWGGAGHGDDDDFLPQQVASSTLREHLLGQLALLNLPLRDRRLATALIDALDDD